MIAEAFLLCALAMPAAEFHHPPMTIAEARTIHLLVRDKDSPLWQKTSEGNRALLIGVPAQWIFGMGIVGVKAWRLTKKVRIA